MGVGVDLEEVDDVARSARSRSCVAGPRRLAHDAAMKRTIAIALAAAAVAAVAPGQATAAPQLATGSTDGLWRYGWDTTWFVSRDGHVDIWTICRPQSNRVRVHTVFVFTGHSYTVPCDRQGHWLRRVAVAKRTWLYVSGTVNSLIPGSGAIARTSVYGYGRRAP
jgi:hypothetical protein